MPKGTVALTGGTGLIGRALQKRLEASGWIVRVVSRGSEGIPWEDLPCAVEGAVGVIHLAGENLAAHRWTADVKNQILQSRLTSTRRVVEAINAATRPPRVLVTASAVGFYGPRGPEFVGEEAAAGSGFLASVCEAWETEALRARTRVARLRLGVVLAREGGALPRMALPALAFLGVGLGAHGLSWIHIDDAAALFAATLEDERFEGPLNAAAPDPRSSDAFMQVLARTLHRPIWPLPPFLAALPLRLILGGMAQEMLLQGAFVLPRKALDLGFTFRFPTLEAALADLLGKR